MIHIDNITYTISGHNLLQKASAIIPSGYKIGVVGRNGSGKTTFFNLLNGTLETDAGTISLPHNARIGGLKQEIIADQTSLLETVLAADTERSALLTELETVVDSVRISAIHERLNDINAYSAPARAAHILKGLGFDSSAQMRACNEFSGGWQMRVALAGVLFVQPDILLLDEPTNYLDLEGTIWLENYLMRYPYTMLIISHNRTLLNKSVQAILHLHDQKLILYQGNYDSFNIVRQAKLATNVALAKKQQAKREHLQKFINRFRAKASKAKQAQSRLKMLERLQPLVTSIENRVFQFNFPTTNKLSSPIISIDNVSVGYQGNVILKNLNLRIDQEDCIALLGANGKGKSTFLKLLAAKLHPISGRIIRSLKLKVGYFSQYQIDDLIYNETPLQHVMRLCPQKSPTSLRALLAAGGIDKKQADNRIKNLSGGQKTRLSLLLATLNAPHLIILDEPTNHLDIESREALTLALSEYQGAVILVSHDSHLINAVADRLWLVKNNTIEPFHQDMNAYKKLLLNQFSTKVKKQKPSKNLRRQQHDLKKHQQILQSQIEVAKCEKRVIKIENIQIKIEQYLSQPLFYSSDNTKKRKEMYKKHHEIIFALEKAEQLWEKALNQLEALKLK